MSPFDRYERRPDARLVMSDGSAYLEVIERELGAIDAPSEVDLVLYNAGMDPHGLAGGVPDIDDDVLRTREQLVFGWAASHRLPIAWVLAGGYTNGLTMAELVDLHRITIRAAAQHTTA